MTLTELFTDLSKAAGAAVVGVIQIITNALPAALLWVTFILACLQLYVFIRDKLRRRDKAVDTDAG
ncbi:hypothetical protein [Cupriavidus sp. BIC8F]|uniref:hypothetical protein n=1 Tax=Cupriavidus sp. BIC8F TaxID=3079014 RepID=UPI002916FD73|nr:hypothetical protein [Cupriavidus sp. BIC8F]